MPRLVIRVNNNKSTAPDDLQPSREIIEYHWNRIIAAGLVIALLVLGVCWLAYYWISSTAPTQPDTPPAEEVFRQDVTQAAPPVELPQVSPSEEAAPAAETAPAQKTTAVPKAATASPAQGVVPPSESAVVTAPTSSEATVQQSATDRRNQTVPPATVTIQSPRITRAQLTTNVVNNAPVDQLPARVPMNEQGLLRIYFFTESRGLQNRSLFHHWYLDGKQMARVRMPTSQQPIIASSSKFIDRYMTGNWEVKVLDDRKILLASARFTVTK